MSVEAGAGPTDQPGQVIEAFEFRLQAEVNAIAATTDGISDKLRQLHVPQEKQMDILLAVQEALANAVVHGCNNDPAKAVLCRLELYANGSILIVVSDPGPGYSRQPVADPKRGNRLFRDHGRGMYLIHQLMDNVSFARNGSEIRMWKY